MIVPTVFPPWRRFRHRCPAHRSRPHPVKNPPTNIERSDQMVLSSRHPPFLRVLETMAPSVWSLDAAIITNAALNDPDPAASKIPYPRVTARPTSTTVLLLPFSRVPETMAPTNFTHDAATIADTAPNNPVPIPTKTPHFCLTARRTGVVISAPPFLRVLEMMAPTVFPHEAAIVADALPNIPNPIPAKKKKTPRLMTPFGAVGSKPPFLRVLETMILSIYPYDTAVIVCIPYSEFCCISFVSFPYIYMYYLPNKNIHI